MRGTAISTLLRRAAAAGAALSLGIVPARGQAVPAPMPADAAAVSFVRGEAFADRVEVAWSALPGSATAGYRVSRIEGGAAVPLHDGWYPVDLARAGETVHRAREPAKGAGDTGRYRLDELRMDGTVRPLGEWTLRFDPPAVAAAPVAALPLSEPAPLQEPLSTGAAKIPVSVTGIFSVAYADLAAALELDVPDVAARVAAAELAMRCGDTAVSYLPDAANQRLLFYGWPATNRYTRTNMFWIEPGAGRHIPRVAPAEVAVPADLSFPGSRNVEQEVYVLVEHTVLLDDLYYWDFINAGHSTQNRRTFPVPVDGYAGGPLTFDVRLIGWSDSPLNPDHSVEIRFNGALVAAAEFDGKSEVTINFEVPEADVLETGNTIEVKGLLLPDRVVSYFVVDGFDLAYERYYAPADELQPAPAAGHARLAADRFADPVVFDVTDPHAPVRVADEAGAVPAGWSWPAAEGSRWALRERAAIAAAAPQAAGGGAWMRGSAHRIDYVVVAPRAFEAPAVALAQHRESQGLRTAVAFYEDICDQFAGGLNTPDALRSFLQYAHTHWAEPPWMAVLGGRGDFQYLGANAGGAVWLPALLAGTSGGLRPADGLLADVAGDDGVPDLAVGRIPARTAAQFQAYVAKVIAHEAAGSRPALGHAVFLSDRLDPLAGDFKTSNLAMGAEAAERYTVDYFHLDDLTAAEVRAGALGALGAGNALLHYTGHGNSVLVADTSGGRVFLQKSDFDSMTNPPVPLFLALTCLQGRFDHPTSVYMCEAMTMRAAGGVLALYAPSGLSWNSYAEQLGREIHRLHATDGVSAVGPTIARARQTLGGGTYSEFFRTYNLVGDPAVKIGAGGGVAPPSWVPRFAHWRWERFTAAELADPEISGPDATAPGGAWTNLEDYAHGGQSPGLAQLEVDPGTGRGRFEWTQRRNAADLEYRLWIKTDLRDAWGPAPEGTTIERETLSDEGLERVTAHVPFDAPRLFARLEVVVK